MTEHFINKRRWGAEVSIVVTDEILTIKHLQKDRYSSTENRGDVKIDGRLLESLKNAGSVGLSLTVTNHVSEYRGDSSDGDTTVRHGAGTIALWQTEPQIIHKVLMMIIRARHGTKLAQLPRGAYIFDKDGTLLDTESVWVEAYQRMLAQHGSEYDASSHQKMMGLSAEDCVAILQKTYPTLPQGNQAIQDLVAELRESFDFVRYGLGVHVMPGVREFLQDCRRRDITLAIATSATRKVTTKELAFLQWSDMFKVILTSDDVTAHKPAPDIYLKAAKLLELDPKECLVFEDGLNGIKSARTAGMQVVHVRDQRFCNESPDDVALSITSFEEL